MDEELTQDQFMPEGSPLEITDAVKDHLTRAAKWGRFLAIVGFVAIGLMVLLGLFFGAFMNLLTSDLYSEEIYGEDFRSNAIQSPMFYTILYMVIAVIYFFPVLYLYRFSNQMLKAIPHSDQGQMESSLKNLNSLFKFMGILTIVLIAFYGLVIMFAFFGGLAGML